jgi:hypothetical protein
MKIKRKFKTISPISTKRTTSSKLKSMNAKKTTIYNESWLCACTKNVTGLNRLVGSPHCPFLIIGSLMALQI